MFSKKTAGIFAPVHYLLKLSVPTVQRKFITRVMDLEQVKRDAQSVFLYVP